MDIDQLEYRRNANGVLVPVAIVELTSAYTVPIPQTCKDGVLDRIFDRSLQGEFLGTLAYRLHVPAVIILFSEDMSEVWWYNIKKMDGWHKSSWKTIGKWLEALKAP